MLPPSKFEDIEMAWLKIFRRSVDGGAEENAEEEKDDSEETRKGRARRAADGVIE
jgi:hypothetical protein